MSSKILVADDSLTIQKVINITLANSNYKLVEVLSAEDLIQKLSEEQFDLVLLDFNLSEDKNGFELSKEIKALSPLTQILAMLGTFDTIDEKELHECGVTEKIVKPFESGKFIKKCQTLLESKEKTVDIEEQISDQMNRPVSEDKFETDKEELNLLDDDDDLSDDWEVDSPDLNDSSDDHLREAIKLDKKLNPLAEELEGWGIPIPGVIGKTEDQAAIFPPLIESQEGDKEEVSFEGSEAQREEKEEISFENSEVEEVDEEEISFENSEAQKEEKEEIDFNDIEIQEEEQEELASENIEASEMFELSPEEVAEEPNEIFGVAEEIENEVSPDEFWAAEEESQSENELGPILEFDSKSEAEVTTGINDKAGSLETDIETYPGSHIQKDPELVQQQVSVDEIIQKIMPEIEGIIRKVCHEAVEKVAWETIPDLAENLINKEIEKITRKISDSEQGH